MPNRNTHFVLGGLTGAVAALLHERSWRQPSDYFAFLLGGAGVGAIGGRMPDVLDPPTSPNHRQLAHGILPVGFAATCARSGLDRAVEWLLDRAELEYDPLRRWGMFALAGAVKGGGLGYLSHLLADACTPCGLPLLGCVWPSQ